MTSRLRGEAFDRLEPYITQILEKGYAGSEDEVRKVFNNSDHYFHLLRQSFGDLDEARTAEQRLLELRQKGSVPEYLTKFTQYGFRVAWDERAKMAQFYKGLSEEIKNAMAIQEFPANWLDLVATATRLDDNFRRRAQENKGNYKNTHFQGKPRKHPDEMDWEANAAFRKRKGGFQKKTQRQGPAPKKKGKCYNCGKEGHFARECRSSKANHAKTDNPKEERGRRTQKEPQSRRPRKASSGRESDKVIFAMVRPNERTPEEIERIDALARVHIQQDMEEAQTARRRRPATLVTAPRRQNLLEEEISLPYLAEEEGN